MIIGLNPYGLAFTVGLHATGTDRANPEPLGLDGFVALVEAADLRTIELDWRWILPLHAARVAALRDRLAGRTVVYSHWLAQKSGETLDDPIRRAAALGAAILRLHLTPVLEGGRASCPGWKDMIAHARAVLARDMPRAADAGLTVAIENHQDLGSEELVSLAEELGDHVGIVMDTGNPYAVGEDPVAFATRAAGRIRHVHLKDYVAQFTREGYRLVRCAIGDGAVPFTEIAGILARAEPLTASIEPGALDARHIRLFTAGWWDGYPPRSARELGTMLGRLRRTCLPEDADARTPWERGAPPGEVVAFERGQIERSLHNVRTLGLDGSGGGGAAHG